ncbi:MHYT domain-containing protein [Rhodospirillaceae bacterium SYSU D60014]|uniref:sensor histidine kinase n=1 Tax=Virgifigura deserti TaxID=2268457 RepID=UPI000E65EF52
MTELLDPTYDSVLVALSMGVSILASFVSLDVAARIWPARGWPRGVWIVAAATAMGGGIWSMHFIGMLAFSLPIDIGYDVWITLASLVTAVAVTGVAFAIIADAQGWRRLLSAGAVMGLGVVAMHYTGMAAMRLPATLTYTPSIVATSIAIACVAATAALWIAVRVTGLWWRLGAAVVMAVAVSGMHYVGMAAACFTFAPSLLNPGAVQFERGSLALIVAAGTLLILALELLSAAIDRRFAAFRMREGEILRLSALRFQNLVQSSNDLILVVDKTGRIDFAAPSSRMAIGEEPAALEGRNIFERVSGAGLEGLGAALMTEEKRNAFAFIDKLRIRNGDGSMRDYEATVCNLLDEPSVKGIVLTFHDVTERERSAAELRHAKAIADEANRLKSEFIANMNHELRTPLNAIIGFSEILATDEENRLAPETYREYAGDIYRSGSQLLAVINDILDFSRAEVGQITLNEGVVEPDGLVGDCIRFVVPIAAKKGIRVGHAIAPGTPSFLGDERRLRQVLLNLLSNAVKFTPDEGHVDLRTGRTVEGELEFAVSDSGVGIPADKVKQVFEPFYQVDGSLARNQEGTGLGLAIAKSLAELHDGRLELSSKPGEGTVARLILPKRRIRFAVVA